MLEKSNVLINEERLKEKIKEIADTISRDYAGEEVTLICVLKGATYFAVDLSKKINGNCVVVLDFLKISSYGNNIKSTGKIDFKLDISENIQGKNVIIVEDIIDSGLTLNYLYDYLKQKNPKNLKICVLLDKKERRTKPIDVDYVGFEIEDKFVFGYGLDYEEKYRNLPYIEYIK